MAYSLDLDRSVKLDEAANAADSMPAHEDLWTAGRALLLIALGSSFAWGVVMYIAIR